MRSRTGCLTCRQRKLKCDERKPTCGQCIKASRECVPSPGIVFRHQQNASMNGADDREENNLKGFYGYRETFGEGSVWVQVPKQLTFVDNSDPYNQPPSPTLEAFATTMEQAGRHPHGYPGADWPISGPPSHSHNNSSTHGLEALSAAASGDHYSYVPPQAHMMRQDMPYSPVEGTSSMPTTTPARSVTDPLSPQASVAPSHNLRFILNPSSAASTPIDPSLRSPFERMSTYHQRSVSRGTLIDPQLEEKAVQEHEIAFLLRHFSEGPGQWMDLFDLGTFFASDVPVKAVSNQLLKYAAVAYAAKALGRVHGRKPMMGGPASRQAEIEVYPNSDQVNWFHKGAKYYDVAVSLLRQALQEDTGSLSRRSAEDVELGSAMESQGIEEQGQKKRRRLSSAVVPRTGSDELLAATAILCVYEFLDASGMEWSGHLNGAKSLIDIAKDSMMPLQLPSSDPTLQSRLRISKARKATFWNIARQDMLAAFINNSHTRLNPEELSLWKEAGLMIDDQGYIMPSNTADSGLLEGESVMREDMISNALIWLVSKLVNYMAAGDQLPPEFAPFGSAVPQRSLLEYWYHLRNQFQIWFDGLPLPFKPVAIVSPTDDSNNIEAEARLPEVWYSRPMCASTMQSWHFAQIQLLHNKPHESTQGPSSVYARHNSYVSVVADAKAHSRRILAIALGRPEASVRIHSVQPLYAAGHCLDDPGERRLIVRLLRDIEADTGWATEYRVKQLLEQWGWENTP